MDLFSFSIFVFCEWRHLKLSNRCEKNMLNYSVLYFFTLKWSIRNIFYFLVMAYLCDSRLVLTPVTVLFNVKTTLHDFCMITLA